MSIFIPPEIWDMITGSRDKEKKIKKQDVLIIKLKEVLTSNFIHPCFACKEYKHHRRVKYIYYCPCYSNIHKGYLYQCIEKCCDKWKDVKNCSNCVLWFCKKCNDYGIMYNEYNNGDNIYCYECCKKRKKWKAECSGKIFYNSSGQPLFSNTK